MERRIGLRARTDFRVLARNGILAAHCRGIEISPNGIVIDRGREIADRDRPLMMGLEMNLPERLRPLLALARPIWSLGPLQAFKFIEISDVDRLTLAEHLDLLAMRGVTLN
jgi:hypothetical protein